MTTPCAHSVPVRHLRAAALLLAALAGCSLAPPYQRPAAPVAETFDSRGSAATPAALAAGQLEWPRFFADPGLQRLLHLAMANNRDLRAAMQRIEEARALYGIRRADQLPNIGAGLSAARAHLPGEMSLTGADMNVTSYTAGLTLSTWELDFWGRVRDLKAAALESYLASVEARRAVRTSLVAQIANTYLLARDLDERLVDGHRTLATREESWRIMKRRYEVGSTSRLDASQAEILRDQARAELATLEQQKERADNALVLLVGAPLAKESVPLAAVEPGFVPDIVPGLPSEVLLDRPDVLAAEHRLKAANANIGAARAAFFPRIALLGGLGSASSELDGLFGADTRAWLFVPSLSLPLFDGGRLRANLSLAEARENLAVADYERTVQGAFREVADALADRRWLARQVDVQRAIVATQGERLRLARLRYDAGATSFLEVLDAERAQFAAEQALVQARRALLASTVNLYAALGGGPDDTGAPVTQPVSDKDARS
ncbi:efflux transporter outer membrane subunit [Parasulfuritortus cantonensis]|uniref:Efflux transporter outer membrane subunit n=1 Tax=Parasulfuritortus cantonensis TaxID=2528202 RepID=A0A4R1B6Q1_9PROT|nr:efflux transporter outer membrane subunit [Parasulfuritortus cantonensis]TCJ11675.1 efflux transporter outer membrane subunit [Parasulfuritortus cantonensis]